MMKHCATSTPMSAAKSGTSSNFVDSGCFAISSTSCITPASRQIASAPAIEDSFEKWRRNIGNVFAPHVKYHHLNAENKSSGQFFCELLKRAPERVPVFWILFDVRLIALLIAFAFVIIVLKMVIVTMPYVNKDSVLEISSYAQSKLMYLIENAQEVRLRRPLFALVSGIALTLFSCMMIHMDSSRPGLNPPSPFSPKTIQRFRRKQAASVQLSYMTAFIVGACVTAFIFFDVYN